MAILTKINIPGTTPISDIARITVDDASGRPHTWSYAPPNPILGNLHPPATPLWTAHQTAITYVEFAVDKARTLAADLTLTPLGIRKAFTEQIVIPQMQGLAKLREILDKEIKRIDAAEAKIREEAEAAPARPKGTDIQRLERLELAKAFAALPEDARLRAEEDAKDGKDPQLVEALVATHRYISGIGRGLQGLLRGDFEQQRIDELKMRELDQARWHVGRTVEVFDASKLALLRASDLRVIEEAGLVPVSPASMSTEEKLEFIQKHGAEEYAKAYQRHLDAIGH